MDPRLSTEVAQVCKSIWSFYSRRLVVERLISKVASLVLPSFKSLFCFALFPGFIYLPTKDLHRKYAIVLI